MSRRLSNHRMRPALSSYTHGKREIERIDREIQRMKAGVHDPADLVKLEKQKYWAFRNSMPR